MSEILTITEKYVFKSLYLKDIDLIDVFVDISLSNFNKPHTAELIIRR